MPRPPRQRFNPWTEITPDELNELGKFLDRESFVATSMSVAMLDGLLTAIVIGPEPVMPSEYLPWVWDYENGKAEAVFADAAEAERVLSLIRSVNNQIALGLAKEPPEYTPLFMLDLGWDHGDWVTGFLVGTCFDLEIWEYAEETRPELFEAIHAIAGLEPGATGWMDAGLRVMRSIPQIRDYFREGEWRNEFEVVSAPFVRQGPKIGRNDPCPCGSGKKHKKCCGA